MSEQLVPIRTQIFKISLELHEAPSCFETLHHHPGPQAVLYYMIEWLQANRHGACGHEILWETDGEPP